MPLLKPNVATRHFNKPKLSLDGVSMLVTGGTGSFGQAFIKTITDQFSPSRLVVFSRDEFKQYEMSSAPEFSDNSSLRFFIGDVRDVNRLETAMRGIDIVVHAAALKHVPIAEYNPFECIMTNVHGAENVVKAALRADVSKVITISTDKAVNPINLYGASKLAADKIFVAANNLTGEGRTRFSVVRYGNVIGSRGSVVQLFERLIREGATSLPITDPDMTRFWISLREGIQFVLSSLAMMHGGEIFVPKIPSMRLLELAKAMAPDLPHQIIGIRPGEKLHEALLTIHDAHTTLELEDRYIVEPDFAYWNRDTRTDFGAKRVATDFDYQSNTNTEWLDANTIVQLIREKSEDI